MEVLEARLDSLKTPPTPNVLSQDDTESKIMEARNEVSAFFALLSNRFGLGEVICICM
jgi:hypothetical protein